MEKQIVSAIYTKNKYKKRRTAFVIIWKLDKLCSRIQNMTLDIFQILICYAFLPCSPGSMFINDFILISLILEYLFYLNKTLKKKFKKWNQNNYKFHHIYKAFSLMQSACTRPPPLSSKKFITIIATEIFSCHKDLN